MNEKALEQAIGSALTELRGALASVDYFGGIMAVSMLLCDALAEATGSTSAEVWEAHAPKQEKGA